MERPHTINTELDLKGGVEGDIEVRRGLPSGYTRFVRDGRLTCDYNQEQCVTRG